MFRLCVLVNKLDAYSKKEWEKLTKKYEIEDITIDKFVKVWTGKCWLLENEHEERVTRNK